MALLARLAALAALALALAPGLARADTSNIVFPVAGPVISWKDDYGSVSGGTRQAGNAIAVAPGTPVVATAAGKVRLLWRGSGGWSITLATPAGDLFVYLHLGRDGNRKSAYAPGLRDGKRVVRGQRIGVSGYSGNLTAKQPQLGFIYQPGGGQAVDPYELLASARRLPAAQRLPPVALGGMRLTGLLTWSVRGSKAALLRVRTATIVRGGKTERVERSLMLTLAGDAAIARGSAKARAGELVTGLRVTVWATARKGGGSLVATRVRIEDDT
jgi:peptidoglycan LD-endopeptidase LytH